LLSVKGGPAYACSLVLASNPPKGCQGILIEGIKIAEAPGAEIFPDGTVYVPLVRLVGTWEGLGLKLTEPPRAVAMEPSEQTPFGLPCFGAGAFSQEHAKAVVNDIYNSIGELRTHGAYVLDAEICGHTVRVVVAVADSKAIAYLSQQYGALEISGWLQPLAVKSRP
jgi:hypothetical protein